uniref:Uncharacterized protein n=1 Tax=Anguilla anguilla TaxID=7936 RepID=A0A0E9RNL8_ANGAN
MGKMHWKSDERTRGSRMATYFRVLELQTVTHLLGLKLKSTGW